MHKSLKKKLPLIIFIVIIIGSVISLFLKKNNSSSNQNIDLTISINKKNSPKSAGTFIDERDHKTYRWVQIGDQTWMAENLAYKPESGFSIYENNQSNLDTYGYLYDWKTAQDIAPKGWHLPSKTEWETLYKSLGQEPAGQLKEEGTDHWQTPNSKATNKTKFTALPGGGNFDGDYLMLGQKGFFWTSNEISDENAYALTIESDLYSISWYSGTKVRGLSVRCIKD